jgi:polyhydroxyalkanoate synthesis regulator phasin
VGILLSICLVFLPVDVAYANTPEETVIIALGTATTQVQESEAASAAVAPLVQTAITEAQEAQQASTELGSQVSTANTAVSEVNNAITVVTNATGVDQSSTVIIDAKGTVTNAQTAIDAISTIIAQSELSEATTARTAVTTAINTAATEFSQANASISDAQQAINNLQATIATVRTVLQGVDDAGIQMILPFSMQMGGVVYNSIYVGSNATITFGTNEGYVYWDTPNAPSISVGGMDWTTWSYGSGITYATTENSLDISWDLRAFPTTDSSIQLTQLRFNADVNPTTGAWIANVSGIGPHVDSARWNYRPTAGGTIIAIVDQDTVGTNEFQGSLSQGDYTVPINTTDNSAIQATVDAANAQLAALNQRITAVVLVNNSNQQLVNTIPSVSTIQSGINAANTTKASLQTLLTTRATNLTNAINNYIPTPPPIIENIVFEGTVATVSMSMPEGYTGNTWFYTITADDENVENPYAGQTLNTDGAPGTFEITGLTQGSTYTITVANWSGPVSSYDEFVLEIPELTPVYIVAEPSAPPAEEPPAEEPPAEEPVEEEPVEEEPSTEEPVEEETTEEENTTEKEPSTEETTEEESVEEESTKEETLTVEEIISVVKDLVADGNLTAADAEAVLDALMADGKITSDEVNNLSDALTADGVFTLVEKELVADALIAAADGEPVTALDIAAAGLEYRDLPPEIPVEVRTDLNGNPVVITAEVASALLTLESPAALIGAITGCFDPDEAIEGLTEEQKCEVLLALASIGADMSPQERQTAKEVLVAAVLVGQIIVGSAMIRRR